MKVSCSFPIFIYLVVNWMMEPVEADGFSDIANTFLGGGIGTTNSDDPEYAGLMQDGFDMLTGNIYQIKHNLKKNFFSCEEEVELTWQGEPSGRTFKAKCLSHKTKRNLYHVNNLLLIGRADDDFCIFTSRPNEYYYKEHGKWKKVYLQSGVLKEKEITSHDDVTKITERVKHWTDAIDQYSKHVKKIQEEQIKAIKAANEVLAKANHLRAETANTVGDVMGNLEDLGYISKEQKDKLQTMIQKSPLVKGLQDTMTEWQKLADKKLQEMTEQQAKAQGKSAKQKMDKAVSKMQQTQRKVTDELRSEYNKFGDICNDLIRKGF